MMWTLHLATGIAGLLVGSFLNVVIHRVPRGESIVRPGSHCPRCQQPIAARHNVPVLSWLLLRGRCAHCAEPISARYPLVEAGTGALFVAVSLRFGADPALPAYLYLAAIAVALAMIDVDVKRLPNAIVLPSYGVGLVLLLPAVLLGGDWAALGRGLLAMTALFTLYFVLTLVHPNGMGFGDVKLAGLLGLYLGWLGWSSVWFGTLAGFILGSVVGLGLMALGRANRKTALPFGPAMLAGAFLAVFAAAPITHWYASLLTAGA
ncbi:prepilin peptidase [Pilimelia anulata]|uniref:Prepilin leader peptidase/N-methyltransferase n=1 Tax=Pilimelia anulata TaxID=53371 RepID=A0A8J3B2L0_9ACTN|nr:A24 family peptidase [Pilimelia anulata]GGJ76136.1 prepilin peptidase [Pilimelia anulata]